VIIQCTNCQDYGHSKSYCAHPPRCVRCVGHHLTSACTQPKNQPPTCTLCGGSHAANYRGCNKHKNLQRLHRNPTCALCGGNHSANYRGCQVHNDLQKFHYGKNIPNNKYNLRKEVNYSFIVNKGNDSDEKTMSSPPNIRNTTSYANLNSQPLHPPDATANQSESNITTQLSSFISEFKLIINTLISLLTAVVNRLMNDDK